MALRIKLVRLGRKKKPFYRIVVAEKRSKVMGRAKLLGFYDPEKPEIVVNKVKLKKWLDLGSQPTDSVRKLLKI